MNRPKSPDLLLYEGGLDISIDSRVAQDRRLGSRISTLLSCQCTCRGISHEAVVLNLSLNGALVSSRFLPPVGSEVILTLQTPLFKGALTLEGTVTRADQVTSTRGTMNRFGVQFSRSYLDLISLISRLNSERPKHRFGIQDSKSRI